VNEQEKLVVANEIAKTFELYGFEMSFSEFKDIFELGAAFGYQLALIAVNNNRKKENIGHAASMVFSNQKVNTKL